MSFGRSLRFSKLKELAADIIYEQFGSIPSVCVIIFFCFIWYVILIIFLSRK